MDSDSMKMLFLDTLKRSKSKYRFKLENFCIMGNHFHLIVRPDFGTSLPRLMQWIMSVFAMAWNRRHGLVGHVWGGRYFSRILDGLRSYLETSHYINVNPVAAGLVVNPDDWRFGGSWHWASGDHTLLDPGAFQ